MTARALSLLLVALAVVVPRPASADKQELYTFVTFEPQLTSFTEPIAASTSATRFTPAVTVGTFYGLTNTLHVGAVFRGSLANDLRVDGSQVRLPDGTPSEGNVYFNHRAIGFGALAYYRFDTGRSFAPAVEAEVGFTSHEYSVVAFGPAGEPFTVAYPSTSELRVHLRATAFAEYRVGNHLHASAGVGFSAEPGGLAAWQVVVPVRFAWIW
jgi:hypothetical protein